MCDDGVLTQADETSLSWGREMASTDRGPVEVTSRSTRQTAVRRRTGERPFEAEDENNGPDLLRVVSYGLSLDEIRHYAVTVAEELYGDDAALVIEEISTVSATQQERNLIKGPFNAEVSVRCVNFTELRL